MTNVKNALQVQYDLDQDEKITYDFIANSMAADAANQPDHIPNRNTSGLDSQSGSSEAPTSGVKGPTGEIFTAYYKNFASLSKSDKQAIFDERKRLNIAPKQSRGGRAKRNSSSIKTKKGQLGNLTRAIASLKTRLKDVESKKSSNDEDEAAEEPQDDAGNEFGGRKKKKGRKE